MGRPYKENSIGVDFQFLILSMQFKGNSQFQYLAKWPKSYTKSKPLESSLQKKKKKKKGTQF